MLDPVSEKLFLRKSDSARNRTRNIWVRSEELWPLGHKGRPPNCNCNHFTSTFCRSSHFKFRGQVKPTKPVCYWNIPQVITDRKWIPWPITERHLLHVTEQTCAIYDSTVRNEGKVALTPCGYQKSSSLIGLVSRSVANGNTHYWFQQVWNKYVIDYI
jgi:hypothetical protein